MNLNLRLQRLPFLGHRMWVCAVAAFPRGLKGTDDHCSFDCHCEKFANAPRTLRDCRISQQFE
jgi:hypothetical protein